MENFFMSEVQAAREEEEEAARRRFEVFKPSSREGGSLVFSTSFTSSASSPSSPSSRLSGVRSSAPGFAQQETAAEIATAPAAAITSDASAADAPTGGASTAAEEVDLLDVYMSSIAEQVRKQDEETRQRLQREAEAVSPAAAAATQQGAEGGGAGSGGTTTGELRRTTELQQDSHVQLSAHSSAVRSPGENSSSFSSCSTCSQRIFADDDDPLADSVEHVFAERQRAAEAQAARAAHGARKRRGDAAEVVSDDEDAGEERMKSNILPSIDHSKWLYPSYVKDIYKESKQIEDLTHAEVGELKRSLQLRTFGKNVPRPIASFLHLKDTFSSVRTRNCTGIISSSSGSSSSSSCSTRHSGRRCSRTDGISGTSSKEEEEATSLPIIVALTAMEKQRWRFRQQREQQREKQQQEWQQQ